MGAIYDEFQQRNLNRNRITQMYGDDWNYLDLQ